MGNSGAACFRTLTPESRDIPKPFWDDERMGQICTQAQTFADWKSSIEKLCSITKRCTYIKEMNAFFKKVDETQAKALTLKAAK